MAFLKARYLPSIIGLFIIFLLSNPAQGAKTLVLVSSSSHFEIMHHLEDALAATDLKIKIVHLTADTIKDKEAFAAYAQICLITTIGAEALANVLKTQTNLPILSILSRKNAFHTLIEKAQYPLGSLNRPITAIYLDQPLKRQLNLIQSLLPPTQQSPVGVLLGPDSQREQAVLQALMKERQLTLNTLYVNKTQNPVAMLDGLLNDTKVVLAIPDNQIYHRKTARGILLTAFHRRVPLIAYSRTFVNNGALAAVYTTTKQLALQTAKQITELIQNPKQAFPAPQYPKTFSVTINKQVARSLGIKISDEATLRQAMIELEANEG